MSDLVAPYNTTYLLLSHPQDPLGQYRDVLPVTYAFGTARCWSGYEGIQSEDDRFLTCHYNIFEPSWLQRNSIPLIVG